MAQPTYEELLKERNELKNKLGLGSLGYDADTATQSPSLSADVAVNNAYSKALQTEAATGDAYPRIDYGSDNPFSAAANMGQYMADQAALSIKASAPSQIGGSAPSKTGGQASSSGAAPTTAGSGKEEAAESNSDLVKDYRKRRAGVNAPELMQAQGQQRVDRAKKVLDDPEASKKDRALARARAIEGRDQRNLGRIAGRFRDRSEAARNPGDEHDPTKKDRAGMDRSFGKALGRFGVEKATEMASAYGRDNYSKGKSEITDQEYDTAAHKLARLERRRDAARGRAGGKNYRDIKGTGEVGTKRRRAAERARFFNKKINRQIGKMSRKYGAETAVDIGRTAGVYGNQETYS